MRLNNFILFTISIILFLLVLFGISNLTQITPTAILYIPTSENTIGGGVVVQLPNNLTNRQAQLLNMAYNIAKSHGHRHPQLLQGIILQESNAGNLASYRVAGHEFGLPVNRRYYGVAQIKLAAAKDVLIKFPSLWKEFNFHTRTDEEVISKLISDDKFNLTIASKYLIVLQTHGFHTMKELALAYNQGPAGARRYNENTHNYSVRVMRHIQNLSNRANDT